MTHRYSRSIAEARSFRQAVKAFLFCPHCGVSDQSECVAQKRSMTAVVMKCLGCGLRYHVRRENLAEAAHQLADQADDPAEAQLYERLADLLAPPGGEGYKAWRRHHQWHDPDLAR